MLNSGLLLVKPLDKIILSRIKHLMKKKGQSGRKSTCSYKEINLRSDIQKMLNLLIHNQVIKAQGLIKLDKKAEYPNLITRMSKVVKLIESSHTDPPLTFLTMKNLLQDLKILNPHSIKSSSSSKFNSKDNSLSFKPQKRKITRRFSVHSRRVKSSPRNRSIRKNRSAVDRAFRISVSRDIKRSSKSIAVPARRFKKQKKSMQECPTDPLIRRKKFKIKKLKFGNQEIKLNRKLRGISLNKASKANLRKSHNSSRRIKLIKSVHSKKPSSFDSVETQKIQHFIYNDPNGSSFATIENRISRKLEKVQNSKKMEGLMNSRGNRLYPTPSNILSVMNELDFNVKEGTFGVDSDSKKS